MQVLQKKSLKSPLTKTRIFGCSPSDPSDCAVESALVRKDLQKSRAFKQLQQAEAEYQSLKSTDTSDLSWDDLFAHAEKQHAAHQRLKSASKRLSGFSPDLASGARKRVGPEGQPSKAYIIEDALRQGGDGEGALAPSHAPVASKASSCAAAALGAAREVSPSEVEVSPENSPIPYDFTSLTEKPELYAQMLDDARSHSVLSALLKTYGYIGIGKYRITRSVWDGKGKLDYGKTILREYSVVQDADGKSRTVSKLYAGSDEEKAGIIKNLLRESKRDYRYWIQHYAKRLLYKDWVRRVDLGDPLVKDSLPSFTGCMAGTFPRMSKDLHEEVQQFEVHEKEGKISFVGLTPCGSMLCPVCGPRLTFKRMLEFTQIFYSMLEQGYSAVFVTRTVAHTRRNSFLNLRSGFKKATEIYRKSYGYKQLKKFNDGNTIDYVSGYEVTADDPCFRFEKWTGWHYHVHEVYFVKPGNGKRLTQKEVDEISVLLKKEWVKALQKVGMRCDAEKAMDVVSVSGFMRSFGKKYTTGMANSVLAALEKGRKKEAEGKKVTGNELKKLAHCRALVRYMTKGLGFELTGGPNKHPYRGTLGGRRVGVGQLLERAVLGDRIAQNKWSELYWESRGMHWFDTSRGLRKKCGLEKEGKEKTDEELLRGQTGHQLAAFGVGGRKNDDEGYDESYFDFDENAWRPILYQGRFGHFRSVLERAFAVGGRSAVRDAIRVVCDVAKQKYDILDFGSRDVTDCAPEFAGMALGKVMVSGVKSGPLPCAEDAAALSGDPFEFDEKACLKELKTDFVLKDSEIEARLAGMVDDLVKADKRLGWLAARLRSLSGVNVRVDGKTAFDMFIMEAGEQYVRMDKMLTELMNTRKEAGYDDSVEGRLWARRFMPVFFDTVEWHPDFHRCVRKLGGKTDFDFEVEDNKVDVNVSVSDGLVGYDYSSVKVDFYIFDDGREQVCIHPEKDENSFAAYMYRTKADFRIIDGGSYDDVVQVIKSDTKLLLEQMIRVKLGADQEFEENRLTDMFAEFEVEDNNSNKVLDWVPF